MSLVALSFSSLFLCTVSTLFALTFLCVWHSSLLIFVLLQTCHTFVKLCPYDEEEPHIWFRLIKAQFAAAGIKLQKLKYANALASLPKQVLQDILDTLDVCRDSDELFDFLIILC
jgi:hypothetical protein